MRGAEHDDRLSLLKERLKSVGWGFKEALYAPYFEEVVCQNGQSLPKASIVIIAAFANRDTVELVNSLDAMPERRNMQVILVDNGCDNEYIHAAKKICDVFVKLNANTGAYLARNVGSIFAEGEILVFLDDDAGCHPKLVAEYLEAFSLFDAYLIRGSVLPKTDDAMNATGLFYFMGEYPYCSYTNVEGNVAVKSKPFFKIGGWDDDIRFGGGGLDLSYRLTMEDPDMRKQAYWPYAIIYHDYKRPLKSFIEKRKRQMDSYDRLLKKLPHLAEFRSRFHQLENKTDALLLKDGKSLENRELVKKASAYFFKNPSDGMLADILRMRGWQSKFPIVSQWVIDCSPVDPRNRKNLSLVLYIENYTPAVAKCLAVLDGEKNSLNDVEIILVAQANALSSVPRELLETVDTVVKVRDGIDYYLASNIGAAMATGLVLLFVDPCTLPLEGFLYAHVTNYVQHNGYVSVGDHFQSFQDFKEGSAAEGVMLVCHHNFAVTADVFFLIKGWREGIPKGAGVIDLSAKLYGLADKNLSYFVKNDGAKTVTPHAESVEDVDKMDKERELGWQIVNATYEFSDDLIRDITTGNTKYRDYFERIL